jgi:hypothetical protein
MPRLSSETIEALLPYDLANHLFIYDPYSGSLIWRPRDVTHFRIKTWNTRFALKQAGAVCSRGYLRLTLFKKSYNVHRIAWLLHYGEWPKFDIDHVDHDTVNNRINNLRDVSVSENGKNRLLNINSTTGVCGVVFHSRDKKWQATIQSRGRVMYLGAFSRKESAVSARRAAEIKYGFHENHGAEK